MIYWFPSCHYAFSYVHVLGVWLSAALIIQQAWTVAQNAPLCGRFASRPRDLHSPYILSFRTQASHRPRSCTDLQFNRFVIYITSLSLFDGAEHKPCESSLFWRWIIPSWFSSCLSLTLRVPCALYSTNSKKKKIKKIEKTHAHKMCGLSFPLKVNPSCIFRLQGSRTW